MTIPAIDLSPIRGTDKAAIAELGAEVDAACRQIGFLVVKGHGVDPGLIAALGTPAGPDDPVVDPLAIEHAVQWLRRQGVSAPKPLHLLRKEFGSLIAASADLLTASRQLRHGSLAVTAAIYVESRRKASPAIGQMLAGGAA